MDGTDNSGVSQKIGYIVGCALSVVVLIMLVLPGQGKLHSLGPANTGHEKLRCESCHVKAPGTIRQQLQANIKYFLGLRHNALCIYLFVTAPTPLPDEDDNTGSAAMIPIETVFTIVAAENDAARSLYTKEIVDAGQKAGLIFDEHWRDEHVEAGPLPALFLREASSSLQRSEVPLDLFLGSDFPISPANKFQGTQTEKFDRIKHTGEAQFFYASDTQLYTAMFADYASAQACVTCHNAHPDSPKKDWVLHDVMGATTWSYPREAVTAEEMMTIIRSVRQGFKDAYTAYIEAAQQFSHPPEIGEKWPRDGFFIPDVDVFLAAFEQRASRNTLNAIMDAMISVR